MGNRILEAASALLSIWPDSRAHVAGSTRHVPAPAAAGARLAQVQPGSQLQGGSTPSCPDSALPPLDHAGVSQQSGGVRTTAGTPAAAMQQHAGGWSWTRGCEAGITAAVIRRRYRELSVLVHPDKCGHPSAPQVRPGTS